MKFCTSCGAGNVDSRTSCSECGASLPTSTTTATSTTNVKTTKATSKGKGKLGAVIAGVLGFAGVAALVVTLLSGSPLTKALSHTTDGLRNIAQEQTMLQKFQNCDELLSDRGKYSTTLQFRTGRYSISLDADYSEKSKTSSGEISFVDNVNDIDLELQFAADKKDLQISAPEVLTNLYGTSWKDMQKKFEGSFLDSLLPDSLPKNVNWKKLASGDMEDVLKQVFGEKYHDFKKTVQVEKMGARSLRVNGESMECKAYRITWSSKALHNLLTPGGGSGILKDFTGLLNSIIPEVEPDCLVYVNKDGYLVAVDYVSMGAQCLFVLEGQENPWEQFSLTVKSLYGDTVVYNGGAQKIGSIMRVYLENQNERLFLFQFDDTTGEFSLETRSAGNLLKGRLFAEGSTMELEISWYLEGTGNCTLFWSKTTLNQEPEKPLKGYINVLDMSLTDIQRLLIDLGIKLF